MHNVVLWKSNKTGRGWQRSFVQDDNLRDLLGFKPTVIHKEYNLSPNPVIIPS